MRVLGIETSCDETAVGIVDDGRRVLAHALYTQRDEHARYGGVVPEVAARAHLDRLDDLVRRALGEAGVTLNGLDGIAATVGPGLIGGVMVGAVTAKAMAAVTNKPFIAVNHLEAHALTARLTHDVAFPYLLLLVSGGHCQLALAEGVGRYRTLGTTQDDAAGECFDKVAKVLGLGHPGGPALERAAMDGDPAAYDLPQPLRGRPGCDFSFSGLKTAVRQLVDRESAEGALDQNQRSNIAASLQATMAAIIVDRAARAFAMLGDSNLAVTALVAAGGVAANGAIRAALTGLAEAQGVPFIAPPPALCTDNGVMVAWAGLERLRLGMADGLDARARPRWPLNEIAGQ